MKTPLFMDRVLIFPFPSTKTAISMDNKKPSAKLEFIGVVLINTIRFPFLLNGIANHRHGISLIDIRKDMPYHYLPDIRVFFNNVFGEIFIQQNLVICV